MARDIDDVIRYVEQHRQIPPVFKELIRLRLDPPPDRAEVEAAKKSWAERQATSGEDAWVEKPEYAPAPLPPQAFVDASDDPPPAPGEGSGGSFGPFRKS
jgi:hypothetical protein